MTKTCIVCGKEFEVDRKHQKQESCSSECKKKRMYQLQKEYQKKMREEAKLHKTRTCKLCGAEFKPIGYEQTCPECKYELKRINSLKPEVKPKEKKQTVTVEDVLNEAKAAGFEPCQ